MIYHLIAHSFTAFLPFATAFVFLTSSELSFIDDEPIELIPVDAGVEDRGALGNSLRVVRTTFQQDHSFEKLYKVAGSEDIYVRKSGGLQAIFRSSEYVPTSSGDVPIVPAGTVYCIGEIRPELIGQLGLLQEPLPDPDSMVQAERVKTKISTPPIVRTEQNDAIRVQFIEDETYRRRRLASFVLDIVLSE